MVYCKRCGKRFKKRGSGKITKKFCSASCRARYNALKRHHRLQPSPEYRKKRKKWFDDWRRKNRKHFNNLVREPNRLLSRKRHEERKSKGLCIKCGGKRDSKFLSCLKCRIQYRAYSKK